MFQTSEECHSYLESIDKLVFKGKVKKNFFNLFILKKEMEPVARVFLTK